MEQSYKLQQTDNKRQLIFDHSKVIATKPYNIYESKIVPLKHTTSSKTFFINNKFIKTF